jgi:hypothetical protein
MGHQPKEKERNAALTAAQQAELDTQQLSAPIGITFLEDREIAPDVLNRTMRILAKTLSPSMQKTIEKAIEQESKS